MKGSVKNLPEYILGADPGKHGGIVLLNTKYNPVEIKPGDIVQIPVHKNEEGRLNTLEIWDKLLPYRDRIVLYVQEEVHALFGSSASGTFFFGEAAGSLYTTLNLLSHTAARDKAADVILVQPKIWQKTAWIPEHIVYERQKKDTTRKKKDTKATSTNAAASVFPGVSFVPPRCRTVHDGLVDAALIAYYGLRKLNG